MRNPKDNTDKYIGGKEMENLISRFKETKCDLIFYEIYKTLEKDIQGKIRYYKSKGFDEHTIIAGCDDALMESIDKWDEEKSRFRTFFKRVIDHRVIDAHRKRDSQTKRELYEMNNRENEDNRQQFYEKDKHLSEFPDVESEVVEEIESKEQRQLFREILKKVDEPLRQQLLVIADGRSANYAARQFGMHHQTLNRKISQLSRKYSERWIELRQYA